MSQMCSYYTLQNNYMICCANGILSFLRFVIWVQSNPITNNRLIKFMYCTLLVPTININLFIAEGRKREVDLSLGLFKTIYCDFLSWCFQFSIRMIANLTHSERDYFERLATLISLLSMYSICEGNGCEG